jgi:hypothetical protein
MLNSVLQVLRRWQAVMGMMLETQMLANFAE